ncbi:hypothetical protein HW555_004635 [Spodoptera exigua]|uniref:KHDC4/BBP-like KH-domain type I domain-containing protein n=1 Tax=Spodoptera exigua TaxID=7107 RepID=A0A835GMU2_SPOEX|nr:hypothetical protein HW555_004635 [Spodoptera exigua]
MSFNFVGRILGPRGMTAKQLEQETGCKIMVRGKGSMRDKKKEDANRGKPNWEHLADDLHVLLTVEDTENRAKIKLARAVDEVKRLLVPQADGEDELKKRQLMELAIINGTYRDSSTKAVVPVNDDPTADEEWRRVAAAAAETQRLLAPGGGVGGVGGVALRTQAPLGAPSSCRRACRKARRPACSTVQALRPPLACCVVRRAQRLAQVREHPYQRTALPAP